MRYLFSASLLFLLLSSASAQSDRTIAGRVLDRTTKLPVSEATIHLSETESLAITDRTGEFEISGVAIGDYQLTVTHVAYRSYTISLSLSQDIEMTIVLDPATIPVEGMTVTASRVAEDEFSIPTSVSITPRASFYERDFSTTAEVLREEPGILVQKTTYGHGAPIVRGLIGKHVLLLYDGIRLNKPTFRFGANQYLNTVDLESLEKIEVVRGPSSVMYGSDALGGAVNLIPSLPVNPEGDALLTPHFSSRYSSADDGRSFHLRLSGGYDRVATTINGTYKKIGDLRAGGDVGRQEPTGWDETNVSTSVAIELSKASDMRFDYLLVRQNEVPRYDKYVCGDFQQYIYDPQNRDLVALTFETRPAGLPFQSLKTGVSYQRELEGQLTQKTGSSKVSEAEDKITSWGGYFQGSMLWRQRHWLTFGWEYYYDRVSSTGVDTKDGKTEVVRGTYPDESKYHSAGVFIQDEFSPADRLTFTLGARYSYLVMKSPLEEPFGTFDQSYQDLTGSVAISYKADSGANLVGRWSRGFRAPNLNDAVVLKYSSSGVDAPSTDLDPECSNNYEIGLKLRKQHVSGSLFCFYTQLEGLIDRVPGTYQGLTFFDENGNGIKDSNEYDIYQRRNIDRARIYGFEVDSRLELNPKWEARAQCFWTWGEDQTGHEPLSRIPPLMGLLALRLTPVPDFWVEGYVRFAGDQKRLSQRDIDDTRIDAGGTPSWTTLNFRSQWRINRFAVNLGLENITDTDYKEHGSGIYSAGRNLTVSLSYDMLQSR